MNKRFNKKNDMEEKSNSFISNEKSFYARLFVCFQMSSKCTFKVNNKIKYNRKSRAKLVLVIHNRFLIGENIIKPFLKKILLKI